MSGTNVASAEAGEERDAPDPIGRDGKVQRNERGLPKAPELFSEVSVTGVPGVAVAGAVMEATDAETAARACAVPSPRVGSGDGGTGVAVLLTRSRIWADVRSGLDCQTSDAIPATCGADMLVPPRTAELLSPGTVWGSGGGARDGRGWFA